MLWQPVATIWTVRPLRLIARAWNTAGGLDGQFQLLLDVFLSPVSVVHRRPLIQSSNFDALPAKWRRC